MRNNYQSPRLMILGGSASQIPLIKRAQEMGFYTIVADQNIQAEGCKIADSCCLASTFDPDAVSECARRHKVHAISTSGTDQPVLTAAIAAERLGLANQHSVKTALQLTNKKDMKNKFMQANIPCLNWLAIHSKRKLKEPATKQQLQNLQLPWIIKPADSQGQRGIKIIYSHRELASAFKHSMQFSRSGCVIIEEYYPSQEVTISGWAHSPTEYEIWTISDRLTFPNKHFPGICFAHRFPSEAAAALKPEIKKISQDICRAFSLSHTPLYFQFLIGSKGIMVNEIAGRLGGAYEDEWIPLVAGKDILFQQLQWIAQKIGYQLPKQAKPKIPKNTIKLCFNSPAFFAKRKNNFLPGNEYLQKSSWRAQRSFFTASGNKNSINA
jgi:biotin carboxylase